MTNDGKENEEKESNEFSDKPKWGEMMKGLAMGGLATYFMTEEAIRSSLKEMKLPKDMAAALLDGALKKKDDFYGLMVKEFGKVLSKIDVTQEVSKFLESHRISVEAKVSFEPKATAKQEEANEGKEVKT
jgi:hypothetical protein